VVYDVVRRDQGAKNSKEKDSKTDAPKPTSKNILTKSELQMLNVLIPK